MKESKAPSLGRTPAQKFFDKWQGLFYLIPWIIGFVVFKAVRSASLCTTALRIWTSSTASISMAS